MGLNNVLTRRAAMLNETIPVNSTPALLRSLHDNAVYRKVTLRLVPFLFACFALACLDRFNVGMAQLQMKDALGFTDLVYGLGAGMFFVGYIFFELPSNLLLERIGARITILRIMFCWGLISAATLFVRTPGQFYVARFLLGIFEAGFFPGILLYLTYWYPPKRLARVSAYFISAGAVAGLIAGPLSGWIIVHLDGWHGWRGWQWMFLIEGLPSTIFGVLAYWYLDDRPERASWLSAEEKSLIANNLHHAKKTANGAVFTDLRRCLLNPTVYLLAAIYFSLMWVAFGLAFWGPSIIRNMGISNISRIGIYGALPQLIGIIAMVWVAKHSDAKGERRWHYISAVASAAVGLTVLASVSENNAFHISTMIVVGLGVGAGIHAAMPVFWTLPSSLLPREDVAGGIAMINSLGVISGALSPYVMGLVKNRTGSFTLSLYLMTVMLAVGAGLMLWQVPKNVLRQKLSEA
jgi:MFS family permease